jgi:adenosylcobinamide-phosphate synthase
MKILLLAVLLDLVFGDPPNRWHPVAWIGRLITAGRAFAPRGSTADLALYGTFLLLVVVSAAVVGTLILQHVIGQLPAPLALLLEAWLLKCTFSLRGLFGAVELVRGHLVAGDLEGARRQVATHLVSRPTGELDRGEVASAAIESLAENLTDSWVAPLCFFLVGGLPAAWAYRAVNTADAMIGYREGDLEYLGRATAKVDDALNFIPARLAAWALVAGAWLCRQSAAGARRVLARGGRLTASPNAGQTMAAMAGAVGVTLEKRGQYRLGDGPQPDIEAMDRALRLSRWASALCLAAAVLILVLFPRGPGSR